MLIDSETALAAACVALGATDVGVLSEGEKALVSKAGGHPITAAEVGTLHRSIRRGGDPLGEAFSVIRSAEERRPHGQVYTPQVIVKAMLAWAAANGTPERIVDPGVGSGRFLLAAATAFPSATLVGADIDPLAGLMTRAGIAVHGIGDRARVAMADYRALDLPKIDGTTLFIGNPPYVRHHNIDAAWKRWLLLTAAKRGLDASALAGLHAHFFLATAEHAREGDFGVFITSSEWLDVGYGKLVRGLLLEDLGGVGLHVVEPEAMPFADATTTAAIASFKVGSRMPGIKMRRVDDTKALGALARGRTVSRERLAEATRWTPLTRTVSRLPSDYIQLGELVRVHRGTVTGHNATWVVRGQADLPDQYLVPSVTKARELFAAGAALDDPETLRRVIDLPVDLDEIQDSDERKRVDRFLRAARKQGVHEGYIAKTRRAWWSVGLRAPAPILATYMARRPPTFVRNHADARHINIAHGLYPREEMSPVLLDRLAGALRTGVTLDQGRVYAGGLTKFEPREMERLPVPRPEVLMSNG